MYIAKFENVKKEVFDEVSHKINESYKTDNDLLHVTIYYKGTNIKGDLTIETSGGYESAHKKVLKFFNDEYLK